MYHYDILSVAFLAFACLILAAARYFFRPASAVSEEQMDYMYPARKIASALYLQGLFLASYIFAPESLSSQLLRDLFLPLFVPYDITMMIRTYFGTLMGWESNSKIKIAAFFSVPLVLMLLAVSGLFFPQLLGAEALKVIEIVAIVMSAMWTVLLVMLDRKLRSCFKTLSDSNKQSFPMQFMYRVIAMTILAVVVSWIGYLVDSLRCAAYVVMGLETVLLMIMILPTQRHIQQEIVAVEKLTKSTCCCKNSSLIADKIRIYVEGEKAFLNPKLTVADIAEATNISRTYISKVIKDDFGGFYKYVNCLRYSYLENFKTENPNISLDAAVEQCGFSSRSAYYNARKYTEVE